MKNIIYIILIIIINVNFIKCSEIKYSNENNISQNVVNSLNNKIKIVVSITSYKQRFKNLPKVLNSIYVNSMKPSKVILTIYKDDLKYLTKEIQNLINEKKLELIVSNINLRPHLKYFEVMKKYRDYAVITIDDDIIYTKDLIESLYNSYINNPNCIHARRVHKILMDGHNIKPYNNWIKEYKEELKPSIEIIATNVGGTLYPPDIFEISDENINEIKKCITADDIYLKYLEIKRNIKTAWVPNNHLLGIKTIKDKKTQENALYKINTQGKNLNDKCLKIFNIKY